MAISIVTVGIHTLVSKLSVHARVAVAAYTTTGHPLAIVMKVLLVYKVGLTSHGSIATA